MNVGVHCAFDKMVPLGELQPNPRNYNTHPEDQTALLAKVIRAQGWRHPIVVSTRSGCIVNGHGRLAAAKLLGLTEAPADFQDFASDEDELAHLVADNRIAELAESNVSALKDILQALDTGAFDMDLTGYDASALEAMMTATPPANEVLKTFICPKCGAELSTA